MVKTAGFCPSEAGWYSSIYYCRSQQTGLRSGYTIPETEDVKAAKWRLPEDPYHDTIFELRDPGPGHEASALAKEEWMRYEEISPTSATSEDAVQEREAREEWAQK